ncbi:MAG TPA: protoglobin domain-containing protein [Polyangia bacterium]|nr:protoglobin domain-containing protein [Polyangia bacterium]
MTPTFFENLKLYVGFDEDSSAALRELHPVVAPSFVAIVDDFYAAIEAHPGARAAITGGRAQIERLKETLLRWLEELLLGPHDEAYYDRRARIGRVHVRTSLPQQYMFTAMDRIRVRLLDVIQQKVEDRARSRRMCAALDQIIDLELAVMLETYREDLLEKNRTAERLATIGQLAASLGHELRNPLSVVESSLYLVRQHLGAAAELPSVAKHLDRMAAEVQRANQTIHDLLGLARNKAPRRRTTNLRQLVDSAADGALLPAAVAFESHVPADLEASVDPDQMRQVLVNLLVNAGQALGGRGHVWVEGERGPAGAARLRVRDDGPGVPGEDRRRIFDALYTTKAKGSGLGLALSRRIVEAHGGTIELEPAAPASPGASFLITMPAA